jgi:hypothetical protein
VKLAIVRLMYLFHLCLTVIQPKILLDYTGFTEASILEGAAFVSSKIIIEVQTVSKRDLVAVKRKYEEARYKFISLDFEPPSISDILD